MSKRQRKELKICTCLSNGPAELLFSVVDRVNSNKCISIQSNLFVILRSCILYCTVYSHVLCTQWTLLCEQGAAFIRLPDCPESRNSEPIQSSSLVWFCRKQKSLLSRAERKLSKWKMA